MLKGKNAVVTGSTSGIGLAIARALAGEGANVMLNGFGDVTEWSNAVAAFDRRADCEAAPRRPPSPRRGISWVFSCFPSETYPRGGR